MLNKKPFLEILLWLRLKKLISQEIFTLQKLPETSTLIWQLPLIWSSLKYNNLLRMDKFHQNMFTYQEFMLIEFIFKIQIVFTQRRLLKNSQLEKIQQLEKNSVTVRKLNLKLLKEQLRKFKMEWMSIWVSEFHAFYQPNYLLTLRLIFTAKMELLKSVHMPMKNHKWILIWLTLEK